MFVDLGAFDNEKNLYNQRVENLKNTVTNPQVLERQLEEERLKFKGITRKYLSVALATLKEVFNIDYSLYKVGRDVDANFKTIETTVQKTQTEIANDMNEFVKKANGMNLEAYKINKLNIAIRVIMSYVDDVAINEDENKEFYLNHSKVIASSVDMPVTKKVEQAPQQPVTVQHNPYANQPLSPGTLSPQQKVNNEPLVDPFASIYAGTMVTTPATTPSGQPITTNNTSSVYQMNNQQPISINENNAGNSTSIFGDTFQSSNEYSSLEQTSQSQNFVNQSAPMVNNSFGQVVSNPSPNPVLNNPFQDQMSNAYQPTVNNFANSNVNNNYNQNNAMFKQLLMPDAGMTSSIPAQATPEINTSNLNQAVSNQVVIPNQDLIKTNNIVLGSEKIAIVFQIISAILIPILSLISAACLYFILNLGAINKFIADMPSALTNIALFLVIATICLLLSGPIIALARKRTAYVVRYLIAPTLLSIPAMNLLMELVGKIKIDSMETMTQIIGILVIAMPIYFAFIIFLLIRGFVNGNGDVRIQAPKWTIFDKLGMLFVIYFLVIPGIYMICSIIGLNIKFLNDALEIIYFTNNEDISQYIEPLFTIGSPIIAALGMILRSIIIFKNSRKRA